MPVTNLLAKISVSTKMGEFGSEAHKSKVLTGRDLVGLSDAFRRVGGCATVPAHTLSRMRWAGFISNLKPQEAGVQILTASGSKGHAAPRRPQGRCPGRVCKVVGHWTL